MGYKVKALAAAGTFAAALMTSCAAGGGILGDIQDYMSRESELPAAEYVPETEGTASSLYDTLCTIDLDPGSGTVSYELTGDGTLQDSLEWVLEREGDEDQLRYDALEEKSLNISSFPPGDYTLWLEAYSEESGFVQLSSGESFTVSPQVELPYGYSLKSVELEENGELNHMIVYGGDISALEDYENLCWEVFRDGEPFLKVPLSEADDLNLLAAALSAGQELLTGTYDVFMTAEKDGETLIVSSVLEGNIVYNDDTDGKEGAAVYTASLAADDLANEQDFLSEVRIAAPEGVRHAEAASADGSVLYSGGVASGEYIGEPFHIVMKVDGTMYCIESEGSYSQDVEWIVLHDGEVFAEEEYYTAGGQLEEYYPFPDSGCPEGVYTVFLMYNDEYTALRVSNVLEFRLVK